MSANFSKRPTRGLRMLLLAEICFSFFFANPSFQAPFRAFLLREGLSNFAFYRPVCRLECFHPQTVRSFSFIRKKEQKHFISFYFHPSCWRKPRLLPLLEFFIHPVKASHIYIYIKEKTIGLRRRIGSAGAC